MTNLWFACRLLLHQLLTLIMSFVIQVHGTRRVEIPETFRIHSRAVPSPRWHPHVGQCPIHRIRVWSANLRRETLCGDVAVVYGLDDTFAVEGVAAKGRTRKRRAIRAQVGTWTYDVRAAVIWWSVTG